MATLGRAGSDALASRFAAALAAELTAVGVTLDYAPVLDILTNPRNPVIGDRALADTAAEVARLGRAVIRTLQGAGVAACGKHFPGHGDTSTDSHDELPLVEHSPDRLRAVEFEPFRAAIQEDDAFIMTAHVLVPSLDGQRPATLSRRVVHTILRDELGFGGVILGDDLEMKAVSARFAVPEAAVMAIQAGCDGLLICSGNADLQAQALEAIVKAGVSGDLPQARLGDAKREQELIHPLYSRLVSAGQIITAPGGYGLLFAATPEDARRLVREEIAAGVDLVKFSLEDGNYPYTRLVNLSNEQVLAMVDEAHRLPPDIFDQLRFLLNDHMDSASLLTLVLLGQPDLAQLLRFAPYQALHQRIAVRYHLRVAGAQNPIFSDGFITGVSDYTKGVPRQINNLCRSALLLGATEGKHILDETDLKRVIHDLDGQFNSSWFLSQGPLRAFFLPPPFHLF